MKKSLLSVLMLGVALCAQAKYDAFHPGAEWLDTDGNPIHAHGGSIIVVDGVYYWYGENKEKTNGIDPVWHMGVNLYSSTDLYNWKKEGTIIPPDLEHKGAPLHPSSCMDRPHILYNDTTKKFVCWMKIMTPTEQGETIMTADSLKGPWTLVRSGLHPCGMSGGDFDLVKASDGKAYYYFERVHSELICADLTEDYTDVTGYYSTHAPRKAPPYVREAPAHFMRDFKHYLITSGTTGYCPNPSETFVADTWHGPWISLGNPHPSDKSDTSFHTQVSSVFKVPGKKDLYIALGDRWMPEMMDLTYPEVEATYAKWFGLPYDAKLADSYERKYADYKAKWAAEGRKMRPDATMLARYVWLPILFKDGKPVIEWRDEWKVEEFN